MIGIDIVQIKRIEDLMKKFGQKGLERFMNEDEMKYFTKPESIAGIWAAKEAFSKAIGTGIGKECSFKDIEIYKNSKNRPYFSSSTLKKFNLKDANLSISHDGGFAIAAVIVIKKDF
ncbi:holo-ACP synthase [Caminibacter sp.]